jgi:hypothetical protein
VLEQEKDKIYAALQPKLYDEVVAAVEADNNLYAQRVYEVYLRGFIGDENVDALGLWKGHPWKEYFDAKVQTG